MQKFDAKNAIFGKFGEKKLFPMIFVVDIEFYENRKISNAAIMVSHTRADSQSFFCLANNSSCSGNEIDSSTFQHSHLSDIDVSEIVS